MNTPVKNAGYTLIEVLVVALISTILAMTGIISYQNFIYNSAMQTASQVLLKDAQYMEKYYAINGHYTNNKKWPIIPYPFVSDSKEKVLYLISLSPHRYNLANENSYRLIATPFCETIAAKNNTCDCVKLEQQNKLVKGSNHSCYICADQDNNLICHTNASCSNASASPC